MQEQNPHIRWGHINVNVSDLEKSIAFYEALGFEAYRAGIPYLNLAKTAETLHDASAKALGLEPQSRGRACIMQLGRGYPKLDLIELENTADNKPLANTDIGIVRLCLATQDLQSDYERLQSLGVTFLSPPQPAQDGMAKIAVCQDPDGALIELIQPDRDKWPPLTPRDRKTD